MHFVERLFAAVRRVGNPVLRRDRSDGPRSCRRVSGTVPGGSRGRRRGPAPLRPRRSSTSSPRWSRRSSSSRPSTKPTGRPGSPPCTPSVEAAQARGLIVIVDGKRNDIGSTAEAYARAYLGKVPVGGSYEPSWSADALTVNPYLGSDGVSPFIQVAAREQQGGLRAGPDQQRLRRRVPGPGGRRAAALSPCRRSAGPVGVPPSSVSPATASSGRSSARPIPANWPSCAASCRESRCSSRVRLAGGHVADVAAAFDDNGLGALINNSRGITARLRTAGVSGPIRRPVASRRRTGRP